MSRENSQEANPQSAAPRRRAPFVRKILLVLLAAGLALLLFAFKGGPFLKAAWQKAEPGQLGVNLPPRAAPRALSATPVAGAPVPVNAAPESTGSSDDQAQRIWTDFEKTAWNEALQTWSGQHQEIPCKPFQGTMWDEQADRQWSHRCSTGEQPESPQWSFYVFDLQEPLIPHLGQFEENTAMLPAETLKTVQNHLQNLVASRFGPGEDRAPKFVAQPFQRDFSWPNLHWQSGDIEIQLFASECDPQRRVGRLRLLARHRTLLEALKEDARLKLVGAGSTWYRAGSPIDQQLAANLRNDFPDAATLLVKERPDPDAQEVREAFEQFQRQLRVQSSPGGPQTGIRAGVIAMPQSNWKADEFYAALLKLLTSAKTSGVDREPLLLLAADRLAWRLPWVIRNDTSHEADWSEWRKQLTELGVTYGQSLEGSAYTASLLKRVWTEYGNTTWGEQAFLVLQRDGWDTSEDCAAGSDAFRTVIQHGLEFEQKHPHSTALPAVELSIAQAYETWWSLSKAPTGAEVPEEEVDVYPANYQEGAQAARQKAIAAYEQLLQSVPQSDEAAYARRVLPRLKLGVDTGQRRYYCTVGD